MLAVSDQAYMAEGLAQTESLLLESKIEEKSICTYLECPLPDDVYLNKIKYGGKKTFALATDDTTNRVDEGIYIYIYTYSYIYMYVCMYACEFMYMCFFCYRYI
jgi:hypothetical protein